VTSDGHLDATYELSGDVAWSYDDLAAAFSEVLGREVTYRAVTPEQHLEVLKDAAVPEQFAAMAVAVDAGIRDGASPSRTATSPASSAGRPLHWSRGSVRSPDRPAYSLPDKEPR
jgi:NAD(P)H dehydrogenase (quinone)